MNVIMNVVVLTLDASTSSYRDPYSFVTSSMLATVTMALFEPLLQNKCSTGIGLSYSTSIIKPFRIDEQDSYYWKIHLAY